MTAERDCPGCESAPSDDADEDGFCSDCREHVVDLERRWLYLAAVTEAILAGAVVPYLTDEVGEA